MKIITVSSITLLLALAAVAPATPQEAPTQSPQHSSAMRFISSLVGGTWVYEGTRSNGETVRSEIQYLEGTSPSSVFMNIRIWHDETIWEVLKATIIFHPGLGRVVVHMVNSFDGYQTGQEIDASETHVAFSGAAYQLNGNIDHWVWTITSTEADEYLDAVMVFDDGSWNEQPASVFRRTR